MEQLTKEQAIAFCENKCYEGMTSRQIAEFQMEQDRLCMPFGVFHKAITEALGRPVFTHELGLNYDRPEPVEIIIKRKKKKMEKINGIIIEGRVYECLPEIRELSCDGCSLHGVKA